MRMHGRDMVSARRVLQESAFCVRCQADQRTRDALRIKYMPHATVCDAHDPAFALCEVCWFTWDAEQSGLDRSVIAKGIACFVSADAGALIRHQTRRILAPIVHALQEADVCG